MAAPESAATSPYFPTHPTRSKRRRVTVAGVGDSTMGRAERISPYFALVPPIPWHDDRTCRDGDPGRSRLPPGWAPPRSPYNLIEEWLWNHPWRMLIACILLNKTTAKQLLNNQVLQRVADRWPSPGEMARADIDELQALIQPLGLHRNRSRSLVRFSAEYLAKDWEYPIVLHGIGKYADDAFRIFCLGEWRTCRPADKQLKKYVCWMNEQQHKTQTQEKKHDRDSGINPQPGGSVRTRYHTCTGQFCVLPASSAHPKCLPSNEIQSSNRRAKCT